MRSATRATDSVIEDRTGSITFEEFCSMVEDGQKADLIDGVIYMASPDNIAAGDLFVWLLRLMSDYLDLHDSGRLFGSRIAFRLSPHNSPEPDIAFVSKRRLHLIRKNRFEGAPDLAIEIVSPESVRRDYLLKRNLYQRYKVPEYWIIDEEQARFTGFRLDAHGKYRRVKPQRGAIRSRVLQGFWLRVEWLWAESRPTKDEALKQILADN